MRFPKLKPSTSIHHVLVGEEDETTFTITHPKHLGLFATPLADDRAAARHAYALADAAAKQPKYAAEERHGSGDSSPPEKGHPHRDEDPDEPVLKRAHEASTIQLFYDLFFVANLTTFTSVHEIDDADSECYANFLFTNALWLCLHMYLIDNG